MASRAPKQHSPFWWHDTSINNYSRSQDGINEVLISASRKPTGNKSFSGVTAWKRKRKRCGDGLVGRGMGQERDTRDKNDKKGNPAWREPSRKGERRRDREPLTSKTPFPCTIPSRRPMITSTLLLRHLWRLSGHKRREVPLYSHVSSTNTK